MGMFDEFILSEPLECPACHVWHITDLQTKSFPDPSLTRWKVGDAISVSGHHGDITLHVGDGWAEAYEWCKESGRMVYYKAIIKDGKFAGVEFWKMDPAPDDECAICHQAYRNHFPWPRPSHMEHRFMDEEELAAHNKLANEIIDELIEEGRI